MAVEFLKEVFRSADEKFRKVHPTVKVGAVLVEIALIAGHFSGRTESIPSRIQLCGDGEPICPPGQSCEITEVPVGPGNLIARSGICKDQSQSLLESALPEKTVGRPYVEIRFDPSQPCGQAGMPGCRNMVGQPGWVENWHPDNQWPPGVIPIVDGYKYNPVDGLFYPIQTGK